MSAAARTVMFFGFIVNVLVYSVPGQWVQTNGPCGGSFEAVAMNDSALFTAIYEKGVYRSTDEGKNWTPINGGLAKRDILSLITLGNDLFAGTDFNGFYIYSGSENRWTPFESKSGMSYVRIYNMVVLGSDVLAATDDGLVRLHKENGDWVDSLILPLYSSSDVALTDRYIFFSARNILARSADNAVSWDTCTSGLPQDALILSFIMLDDNTGFICMDDSSVYTTGNGGDSWEAVNSGMEPGILDFTARNDTILCLYSDRAGISIDKGMTWVDFNADVTFSEPKELGLIGNSLFMATSRGIFRSTFSDRKWNDISSGIVSGNVNALLKVGKTIFAGGEANGKIYRSDDHGMNWEVSDSGFHRYAKVHSLVYFDSILLAGCDNQGLMQSTDFGRSWTVHKSANDIVLTFHEKDGKLLLGSFISGILSLDARGTSFNTDLQEANYGLLREIPDCGCAAPYPRIPSFTALNGTVFASIVRHGVYASAETDTGITWVPTSNGLSDTIVTALYSTNGILLAGTLDSGIYRSTDAGASWSNSETNLSGKQVFAFADYGTVAFAGTEDGVLYSIDSGATWNNGGTEFNESVQSLLIDGEYLLAGTVSSGVWRRPLREFPSGVTSPHMENGAKSGSVSMENRGSTFSCRFTLVRPGIVTVKLFDLHGKVIDILANSRISSGKHALDIDLRKYPSGCYILRFGSESVNRSTAMIISRQ